MLKRRLSLLLVLVLAFNFVATWSAGTPARAAESPGLASYAPPDSFLFATMRTDDAFIDTLDGLREKVVNALPAGAAPGLIKLRALITMTAAQAGLDFEKDVRSWLGDNMAIFVANPETMMVSGMSSGDGTVGVVLDVTDRAAATKFVDDLLAKILGGSAEFKKGEEGTYTVYRSTAKNNQGGIAINDNAMILGTPSGIDAAMGTRAKLFEQEGFKSALALLPETEYNALVYVDTGTLFKLGVDAMLANSTAATTEHAKAVSQAIVAAIGPTVMGATILDDRTLTLDIAQKVNDVSELEKLGVTLPKLTPVDPAFDANIPASAAAVIHGSNLAGIVDYALNNMVSLSKLQSQSDSERIAEQIKNFEDEFLKNTGIDFREDILSWMTGDFALVSGYTSPEPGVATLFNAIMFPKAEIENAFDTGVVFEVTDKAKADTLVAKLETLLSVGLKNNPQAPLTTETIGGAKVLVLSGSVPVQGGQSTKLDLLIGANDKVFVVATRGLAEAILNGREGLDTAATYKDASVYLLPQPTTIAYLSNDGINLLGDLVLAGVTAERVDRGLNTQSEETQKAFVELQTQVRTVLALIESATVSSTTDESGSTISRAVITLAE